MLEKQSFSKFVVVTLLLILAGVIFIISLLAGGSVKGEMSAQVSASTSSLTKLQRGVRNNSEVRLLQQFLADEGHYTGTIDGSFGKGTEDALKKFQTAYGVKATGIFGGKWELSSGQQMPPTSTTACTVDLDGNGIINITDLMIFMIQFGSTGDNLLGDFNSDGDVNVSDLLIFVSFYGQTTVSCISFEVTLDTTLTEVNNGQIIDVDEGEFTDEVSMLGFRIVNESDEDLIFDSIPVTFISEEQTGNDPDDLATSVYLYYGDEILDEKTLVGTDSDNGNETVVFDDLDFVVDAGDEAAFIVRIDIKPTSSELDSGDSIKSQIGTAEIDAIDVEDESGDSVSEDSRFGSAHSQYSYLFDEGIFVTFVSSDATNYVDEGDENDIGEFEITFQVEAFGGDVYIDHSQPLIGSYDPTEISIDLMGSGEEESVISILSSNAEEGSFGYLVEEGDTEEFTVTTSVNVLESGTFQTGIESIGFSLTDSNGTFMYVTDLEEFQSPVLTLN